MKSGVLLKSVVAASIALASVAATAAQPVGSLVSVNGDAFVAREGRLILAHRSMVLQAGDRIITRTGVSANVAMNGCSVNVSGGEMKTLGNWCGSVETASFDRTASPSKGSAAVASIGGGAVFVGLGAVVLIVLAIVIAARNNTRSTSP